MSDKPLKIVAGSPDSPLRIGGIEIPCYVLEDETRVLSQSGVFFAIGAVRRGGGDKVPQIFASKAVAPFVSSELTAGLNSPIDFQPTRGGRTAYGYNAILLVEMCKALMDARASGTLRKSQLHLATQAEILIKGDCHGRHHRAR